MVNERISSIDYTRCSESLMHPLFSDVKRVVLTVVVPTYNEMAVLSTCHQRLRGVMEGIGLSYELLYVDDGSSDGSGEALVSLASQDSQVRVIRKRPTLPPPLTASEGVFF